MHLKSPELPLQKYLFGELSLERRGYRLTEVVAETLTHAWESIRYPLGVTYLATTATRQSKPSVKTRIYRDREKWAVFLDRYFLTPEQVDTWISEALHRRCR